MGKAYSTESQTETQHSGAASGHIKQQGSNNRELKGEK